LVSSRRRAGKYLCDFVAEGPFSGNKKGDAADGDATQLRHEK
jgi:hypothetical protein